jgi:hypothetical protein
MAISRHVVHWSLRAELFEARHSCEIYEDMYQADLRHNTRRILESSPLFCPSQQPHALAGSELEQEQSNLGFSISDSVAAVDSTNPPSTSPIGAPPATPHAAIMQERPALAEVSAQARATIVGGYHRSAGYAAAPPAAMPSSTTTTTSKKPL